jgi:hypothetical protein
MANIGQFATGAILHWIMVPASSPTRPGTIGVGLSLGSPTSVSGSEIPNTSGYSTRQTGQFASPASSPAGSAFVSNTNAMSWANLSAASISGLNIWDTTASNNSGNLLWYGLLAAPRTLSAGDALVIASGALTASLN